MPESSVRRIEYIDNLRVFLTALVVCHHQAIAFGAPGGWYYVVAAPKDIPSLAIMTLFVAVNQAFFMGLFFFMSAYFTRMSLARKSMPGFVRDRLMRLAIPLMVYYFILNPSVVYLAQLFYGRIQPGYLRFMADNLPPSVGWGPMWFVFSLIIFTFVYLIIRSIASGAGRPRNLPLPGNQKVFAFVILIAAITFCVRLVCPLDTALFGLTIGYFPLYICMFAFGIWAHKYRWLDALDSAQADRWFWAAIALILVLPAIVFLGGGFEGKGDLFRGGFAWQACAYAAWEPVVCIGITMKLLVVFRKRFNSMNAYAKGLSKSAYTVYIVHPFFVVVATMLAKDLPLPPLALVLIVCPIVLIAVFACSDVIRQAPLLNKIL